MTRVKDLISQLKQRDVRFILIGGQAAVAQGSAYLTADVDICYSRDRENLANIVRAIAPYRPRLRGVEENLPFVFDLSTLESGLNFTLTTDAGDIDLVGEVTGLGNYEKVSQYSETLQIYELACQVLTLEGLIKSKKALRRPKDLGVIKELEALLAMKNRKGR